MDNRSLGKYGEDLAAEHLKGKGYLIVERNFKNRLGEIDLIAKDGQMICFVEVKTRHNLDYGMPFESVHYHKQRKLGQVALSYLKFKFHRIDLAARFDVISIYRDPAGKVRIDHIINAFDMVHHL